ncbi:MAG TPA: amino acid adenylation domain-containing protein [Stellaceae bacterium]
MSAEGLIDRLAAQGMELWIEEGRLRYRAPADVGTPEILAELRRRRDEIIAALAARAEAPVPLSVGQQALWFLHRQAPQSAAYNTTITLRVLSPLDADALRRSCDALLDRHACLRASFPEVDGRPVQRIAPRAECVFTTIDAAGLDDNALRRRVAEAYAAPFDLLTGPVFRATLFSRGPRDHVLLLVIHHIAADAASLALLLEELEAIYPAMVAGRKADLPPTGPTYADYVRREQALLGGLEGRRLREYWQSRLVGEIATLDLPTDRPRPPLQARRGAVHGFCLDAVLSEQLRELARAEGVTLFMLLAAAFQALLHRYSGQTTFAIGTPTALRPSEFARTVGDFVNPLPLRSTIEGDTAFRDTLTALRGEMIGALEHAAYPFSKMVDDLATDRDASRSPIFQAMFVFQQVPRSGSKANALFLAADDALRVDWGGLVLAPYRLPQQAGQFDLTLEIVDDGAVLDAALKYDTDLFDAATAGRLAANFAVLLRGIVASPGTAVSRLPILADEERHRLLAIWNETRDDALRPLRLHRGFEAQARGAPDRIAVVDGDRHLTYGELDARANRVANFLRRCGVGPDRPVAVLAERSLEMIVAIYGVLKAGGAYLPLDPSLPLARLAFIVEDVGASIVLTHGALEPPAGPARVIRLDAEWPEIAREEPRAPDSGVGPDHLAYVIYTSGSTGYPKGVMIPHRAIVNHLAWRNRAVPMTGADRILQKTPFGFDVSVFELFQALMFGAQLVLARPGGHQDPAYLIEAIERHRVTVIHFVPPMLRAFLDDANVRRAASLTRVLCSGEALPLDLQQRFLATLPATLFNLYGPTEAAVDVSLWRCDAEAAYAFVPLGKPIANTRLYVLDRHGAPQPIGVAGELHIGGVCLARGYHGRPDLTAASFVPDPFATEPGSRLYRTGDLARMLPGGVLQYLGRIDHQVKIRGNRIELGEIEAALLRHPGVREAAVIAREQRLVAYLTLAANRDFAEDALRRHLGEFLPDYMTPSVFVVLDQLPLGANGKRDRKALPTPRPGAPHAFIAPRSEAETTLCGIWAELTGRECVGINDNFFRIGGDSILSIQMASRAARAGLHLSVSDLFQHQTVAELAAVARRESGSHDEQGPVTGRMPLAPIQRWFFDQHLAEPHHFNQALLLVPRVALDPDRLAAALDALVAHHDALRLRFLGDGDAWIATVAPPEAGVLDIENRDLTEAMAARQASLDLARGPLFRASLIRDGGTMRLLIVAHHLVIDGVSWRILVEDLEALLRGQDLPPKTTSYKTWSESLAGYVQRSDATVERDYWRAQLAVSAAQLPRDGDGGAPIVLDLRRITEAFGRAETEALLHQANAAFNTGAEDFLLAALALSLASRLQCGRFRIDLEAHGREAVGDGVDLSRTVGWFTSLFPIVLEAAGEPLAALKAAREARRRVPNSGIGFRLLSDGARDSSILFNYLGRMEIGAAFDIAAEASEPLRAPSQRLSHALQIDAVVVGGRLRIQWSFSPGVHARETVEGLARDFHRHLSALLEQCSRHDIGGYTPSDFPLASVGQEVLDRLPARSIEAVLPLTPMQRGMQFHTLLAFDRAIYHQQLRLTLEGALDTEAFARSWAWAVERHAILRGSVLREGLDEPLLLLHRHVAPAWTHFDWRGLSATDQAQRIAAVCAEDEARGFDLTKPPLLRFTLHRLAIERHGFVLSFHHVLMDGWSLARLIGDVLAQYRAFKEGGVLDIAQAPSWQSYVAWLAGRHRDADRARAYWMTEFADGALPTGLGIEHALPQEAAAVSWSDAHLSETATASLQALAQREGITLGTIVQAAWALLLARYGDSDDVVFGTTVAGRPADLPGIEGMVGLCINTLPVRVRLPCDMAVDAWLKFLHGAHPAREAHGWCALPEIERWTDRASLFDTLLVIENYPVDTSLKSGAAGLTITGGQMDERSNYPLTVIVVPGSQLRVRATFVEGRIEAAAVSHLLTHFISALSLLSGGSGSRRLGELEVAAAAERLGLLQAVETVLGEQPGVERCVAVVRGAGKRLIAYAVAPGASAEELRARLAARLPAEATPGQIVLLEALPLNANGKLDRAALPAPPQAAAAPPQSEAERRIAAIWQEALGLDTVARDDNFFELGGDSFVMARIHAKLPVTMGREIAMVDLYRYPTVRSLATMLARADAEPAAETGRGEERLKHRDLAVRQRRLRRAPQAPQAD